MGMPAWQTLSVICQVWPELLVCTGETLGSRVIHETCAWTLQRAWAMIMQHEVH